MEATASSSSASAPPPAPSSSSSSPKPKSAPPQFSLDKAIRSNILALLPYRCARDDYSEGILLDANENALGHALPAETPATNGQASAAAADSEQILSSLSLSICIWIRILQDQMHSD